LSPLHILALDTTSRRGSVAIARDGFLLHQHSGDPAATHGHRLPGDLMRALEHAGIGPGDLNLLAVASGPGSFTGLRVGVAAMQGLAVARGLRIVPVPTLEALARAAAAGGADPAFHAGRVAAWIDGQRGEVFAAMFEVGVPPKELPPEGGSHVRTIHAAVAGSPASVLDGWDLPAGDSSILFAGDGATRYRDVIEARVGAGARVADAPLLSATLARIAFEEPHRGVAPHGVVPVYVRRPDAELARERRQGRG